MQADRGRKDSRTTPRRDFADVAYNFHRLAALGERSDNTFLRREERSLLLILYMKEDYHHDCKRTSNGSLFACCQDTYFEYQTVDYMTPRASDQPVSR